VKDPNHPTTGQVLQSSPTPDLISEEEEEEEEEEFTTKKYRLENLELLQFGDVCYRSRKPVPS
jgi:ABC-type oligopeptide transport system ATPase subunit